MTTEEPWWRRLSRVPFLLSEALVVPIAIAGCAALSQPAPPDKIEWIDVHVHPIGGQPSAVLSAVSAMDEAWIRKMILMPPPQVHDMAPFDCDRFAATVASYQPRLAFMGGGGSLNPMLQEAGHEKEVGDSLKRRFGKKAAEILHGGAVGFGEITAHHLSLVPGHPYESVPADHPLLFMLADIAARADVVIDLHFDLITEDMKAPAWLASPPNPPFLRENVAAFERLLEYNRKARIVWAHAGSDMLGHWTVGLSRRLLEKHPNLHMSIRMSPGRAPQNHPLTPGHQIKPEWLRLLHDFSDRFVIGGDQFFASSAAGRGAGVIFSQRAEMIRERTKAFLAALPQDLAGKIAYQNAMRIYKLRE